MRSPFPLLMLFCIAMLPAAEGDSELNELARHLQAMREQSAASPTNQERLSRLSAALGEAIGQDTAALDSAERMVAGQGPSDVSGSDLSQRGEAGSLWVFWAQNAPASMHLPAALIEVAEQLPRVQVHDVHMMGAMAWQQAMKQMHDWKTELETIDPARDIQDQLPAKYALLDTILDEWGGFTRMASMRRPGGYLVLEDVTPAVALQVRQVPTFRYISPSGIVHRLDGLGSRTSLVQWIGQCIAWELEFADEYREKLLP